MGWQSENGNELENVALSVDTFYMKLKADDQGRLACAELFPPNGVFDAERLSDGSVRVIEQSAQGAPVVRARLVNGRLRGAEVTLSRETVAAAIRAERDTR